MNDQAALGDQRKNRKVWAGRARRAALEKRHCKRLKFRWRTAVDRRKGRCSGNSRSV